MTNELRFYADSADVDEVSTLLNDGLVSGVTTNPTILERSGRSLSELPWLYSRWESEGAREVFFQTWGATTDAMLENGRRLLDIGPRVVVKVPATREGFGAAATLVASGTSVLLTAVYSQAQALAAATIGVRYIAPYMGRLEDAGRDGVAEISAMQRLVAGTGTDVLAASLRTPEAIVALASAGIPFFTAAPSVLLAALHDDVSDDSAEAFEAAAGRLG